MNRTSAGAAGLKPRLLVVDDVADNRDILCRRFERRGFEVAEADGGHKALELIEQAPFDLVMLDIQMPDLSGMEVLRRIRERHTPIELPVIMVTGRTQHADVLEAVAAAANDYVTKPVDFEKALARVEAQLRKRAEAVAQDPTAPVFFTFKDASHSLPPYPMTGVAAEDLVLPLLSPDQMAARLGGCVRYLDDKGAAYLGVWGDKNVERLHAVLSAQTPKLIVRRERPQALRLDWRRAAPPVG